MAPATLLSGVGAAFLLRWLPSLRLRLAGLAFLGVALPLASVVLAGVANGMPNDEILAAYPDLEVADNEEALHYAGNAVRERELPLAGAG